MNQKTFFIIISVFLLIAGVLHLIRAFLSWEAVIGNFNLPIWISYVLGIFALFMSYHGFRLAKSAKK